MNLWLLRKELDMLNMSPERIYACQLGVCREIAESFTRGELAPHEAVGMIAEIINPLK